MAVLLREAIGDRLRHARSNQRRTLREIARSARVSLGYLSEVERGQKEASSELLASICEALDLPLADLLNNVATDVSALDTVDVGDVGDPAKSRAGTRPSGQRQPAGMHGYVDDERAVPAGFEGGSLVSESIGNDLADLTVPTNGISPTLRTTISAPRVANVVAA